jgi:2-C-methyl-D-erythritol 4-phosphate cytidylyltransferase
MVITAFVVCDARSDAPDPVSPVGGDPMVARAVRQLLGSGVVERVDVLASGLRAGAVERACRGLPVRVRVGSASVPVRARTAQRAGTGPGDAPITADPGGIVLLHDAARPLAPSALAVAVVEAIRGGAPAAVPVLPLTDTVKQLDEAGLVVASPDRAGLRVVQTPIALRRELLRDNLLHEWEPPLPAVARLLRDGADVHCVPGHPLAFPVRTAWDLELAELLVQRDRAGTSGG